MKKRIYLLLMLALFSLPVAAEVLLPILCYHRVLPNATGLYDISPEQLDVQMAYLHQAGYETITYSQWAAHIQGGAPIPEKPIIIGFDDGHRGVYEYALPILERYGFIGVAFVYTQAIQSYPGNMTWSMLHSLHRAGWEIGSHTQSHSLLLHSPHGQNLKEWQRSELFGSKSMIEAEIGASVYHLAWPYGGYDRSLMEMATEWYLTLSTVHEGINTVGTPLTQLRRFLIYQTDHMMGFMAKVQARPLEILKSSPSHLQETSDRRPRLEVWVDPVPGLIWNEAWMEVSHTRVKPEIDLELGRFTYQVRNSMSPGLKNVSLWIPHEDGHLYVAAFGVVLR